MAVDTAPDVASSRLPRWARGAVLVAAFLYMQIGSFTRMVLDTPTGPAFQSWRMYHSRGHEQCKVRAFMHRENGEVVELDWAEVLDWPLGSRRRRVENAGDELLIARALCEQSLDSVSISVEKQCAKRRRWAPPRPTRDEIVCRGKRR